MGTPYMGELRIMSFNFPPKGWAFCNGQLMSINQNQALFSLMGTTYGGNGVTNFALPNLQTRTPLHMGSGYVQGQTAGEYSHTLTIAELPQHIHLLSANDTQVATSNTVTATANSVLGKAITKPNQGTNTPLYPYSSTLASPTTLAPGALTFVGGNQPHENRQPFLVLNICISLQGVFPTRN
jgi:microcystin-dependent protein